MDVFHKFQRLHGDVDAYLSQTPKMRSILGPSRLYLDFALFQELVRRLVSVESFVRGGVARDK